MTQVKPYTPKHKVRIATAASLFDGHDAAINVMRRIIQGTGAEVIHLGHNRSVQEIVNCAVEEDVQGIAITSYQGGHVEYLKYMHDLLVEKGAGHIQIFAGGGGTILPDEIQELHDYGIARIYAPDDGRKMGLQGMINDLVEKCDFETVCDRSHVDWDKIPKKDRKAIARAITFAENKEDDKDFFNEQVEKLLKDQGVPVLGITGTGGAGKSSLVDEFVRRFLNEHTDKSVAIISVDPSRRKSGGALLGDRIRMNSINVDNAYMRSMATRQANLALSPFISDAVKVVKSAGFDLVILESSGIGQADTSIVEYADLSMYVMTPEFGAASQLEKIDMLDFADVVAINKFDQKGAKDALRDVRKQIKRNHLNFETSDEDMPVVGSIASQFNDPGMNNLYRLTINALSEKTGNSSLKSDYRKSDEEAEKIYIIPPERTRYLAEIVENNQKYDKFVEDQVQIARKMYRIKGAIEQLEENDEDTRKKLEEKYQTLEQSLDPEAKAHIDNWAEKQENYTGEQLTYKVRNKEIKVDLYTQTISQTEIPRVSLPKYKDWGDLLRWLMRENVPGEFPYTSGVYPFKRKEEDPIRMFAGEGGPEQTNKRFHYVSYNQPFKRLSTAFDSVTLYGEDPAHRPDIYGKVGNSGVSVATLDDAKKLYSGFDLCDPTTSVSMTINGPAPMILGFFMNAAIDQRCEKYIKEQGKEQEIKEKIQKLYNDNDWPLPEYKGDLPKGNEGLGLMLLGITGDQVLPEETYEKIKQEAISVVRGTVQADILKEDQAQNTCIFSTEFALKMMGDVQEYFSKNKVRNFYSVSISGYHIAEAGANPITQLALTLSNGFTYVENYLHRGLDIDEFAPNFSYFFSNGVDAEYAVIGRVARRIWAKAIRNLYNGSERSQKLKYHIQTSGRSLHAQEIDFNDIRTTLQALYAIYDNCNSLHTNAYDEAITTPTEESVRRAMAIQLIINKELGLSKNENPIQGAFIIEELTDLVEEAVYLEFNRINERGGVLGAMENMYQRNKIQEESMKYEQLKHNGEIPIIGVNTFLNDKGSPTILPDNVVRSTEEGKEFQINEVKKFQKRNEESGVKALENLKETAAKNGNIFEELMEACKYCSLGQLTNSLYDVGGQYRRTM